MGEIDAVDQLDFETVCSLDRHAAAAARFAPRPMLVMHGEDDENVPVNEARQLAGAHGEAELSLLPGAGARLRHDPRAVAILMGWLQRMQTG